MQKMKYINSAKSSIINCVIQAICVQKLDTVLCNLREFLRCFEMYTIKS